MEGMAYSNERGVQEDLVRFAEGKCQLVVGHDLPVLFRAFGAHLGQLVRKAARWNCKVDVSESHRHHSPLLRFSGKGERQQKAVVGCRCTRT